MNFSSIWSKSKAFINSPEGKRRAQQVIDDAIRSGNGKTRSGKKIVGAKQMEQAANALATAIIKTAASYDLPESVMKAVRSISCTKPYQVADGSWRVDLFFTEDLSRESMYSEQYSGIINIIALFNNGYLAQDYVYGWWDGHNPTANSDISRYLVGGGSTWTRSALARPALLFMQSAVDNFNATYGNSQHATAVLDDIYQETPTVL